MYLFVFDRLGDNFSVEVIVERPLEMAFDGKRFEKELFKEFLLRRLTKDNALRTS